MKNSILLLCALLLLLAGCDNEISFRTTTSEKMAEEEVGVYGPGNDSLQSASVSRFDDLSDGGTLNDAVSTHQRYIELLEKHNNLVEAHGRLTHVHRDQTEKIASLTKENAQLKKELADASEMLITMRRELDKWKKDIFAYRQELKSAMDTNRQLMQRIIRILGGEMPQLETTQQPQTAKTEGDPQ
jgi:uncharacterized phage infection (PIP) family protein YhgE